jgi:nitrite reductase (cytochrome c-552)
MSALAHTPSADSTRGATLLVVLGLVVVFAVITAAIAALLVNVFERKQEAKSPFYRVVEINDKISDPNIWGKNFPLQYDAYKRTVDQVRTRYGGSEALPHAPTEADPRVQVSQSKIEADLRLKRMWAGYAFAIDFREERGHAYMLTDQTYTERQKVGQPGTCLNCHASTYNAYKELGKGDIIKGFELMNQMKYFEARELVQHPVACIDCHSADTMQLRVTRPAFIEGIRVWKASQGVEGYDVNRDATRQEMRAYVCGQCHVEYYFRGAEKRLVFPWSKGLKADKILAFYDEVGFKDWTHKETGAAMLKAQHPEFELWNQGIHARSGVMCADCHMPYVRIGAMKISDHHVRSPLLNINRACQNCHKWSEEELLARTERIQETHTELRDTAMQALMELIDDINRVADVALPPDRLTEALAFQRRATFLLDFAEAENSVGFHAPQEGARILGHAIEFCRKGQVALLKGYAEGSARPATGG